MMKCPFKKKIFSKGLEYKYSEVFILGLEIRSSDDRKSFSIGYIGFTHMRRFFILPFGEDLYEDYKYVERYSGDVPNEFWYNFCDKLGDLSILITHSDCEGELSSKECKLLQPCLTIDEEKIRSTDYNQDSAEIIIKKMYEFKDVIDYCANNNNTKLIFG